MLDSLKEVGLGRYESSVYLGLLMDETAKVSEISKRTGVPQPKAYQALDSLVEKGFCTLGSDAVNRYRPVPPDDAMKAVLDGLRATEDRVRSLGGRLEEIRVAGRGQELWAPPIEIIKGHPQVQRFIRARIARAQEQVLLFGKHPHMPSVDIIQTLHEFAGRGGRIQMLAEEAFLNDTECEEEAARHRGLPADIRVVDQLPTKMIVLDRQVAISSITHSGGKPLDLVLRHRGFVEHFVASFEQSWVQGRPLVSESSKA
ncbi:MAG: helix-turn-helix domain-containing protein [Planctomycetota bacterium]